MRDVRVNTATMGKRRVPDLYRAPFPLYSVKVDPKTGLVITAGGGGASKTGIKNGVVSVQASLGWLFSLSEFNVPSGLWDLNYIVL